MSQVLLKISAQLLRLRLRLQHSKKAVINIHKLLFAMQTLGQVELGGLNGGHDRAAMRYLMCS